MPTSPIVGLVLVGLGLLYHYGAMRADAQSRSTKIEQEHREAERRSAHDRKLAQRFRELLSETSQEGFVDRLMHQHACFLDEIGLVEDAGHFLGSAEAHFLSPEIAAASKSFLERTAPLLKFIGSRFFRYPNRQSGARLQLAMQPNWNIDRDGSGDPEEEDRYNKLTAELEGAVRDWAAANRGLIVSFHEELKKQPRPTTVPLTC